MKEKIPAGILAIIFGCLGIHKFYLGYKKEAVIMLLISLLTFGFGAPIMALLGLIEGIIYLTKTDDEFQSVYVYDHKGWL